MGSPHKGIVTVVEAALATADALGAHSKLVAATMVGGDGEADVNGLSLGVGGCGGIKSTGRQHATTCIAITRRTGMS